MAVEFVEFVLLTFVVLLQGSSVEVPGTFKSGCILIVDVVFKSVDSVPLNPL